jgi:hypothetical protein
MTYTLIEQIFVLTIIISLLISLYFFIDVCIFKNNTHVHIFDAWQFPMLLAIFIDIYFVHKVYTLIN